jgi:hypothetical protein
VKNFPLQATTASVSVKNLSQKMVTAIEIWLLVKRTAAFQKNTADAPA